MKLESIHHFVGKWRQRNLFIMLGFSTLLSLGLLGLIYFLGLPHFTLLLLIPAIAFLFYGWKKNKGSNSTAISYLNEKYSELEFSLRLFDEPKMQLNDLQELQKTRISKHLKSLDVNLPPAKKVVKASSWIVVSTFALAALTGFLKTDTLIPQSNDYHSKATETVVPIQNPDSAFIDNLRLNISPPSYTGKDRFGSRTLDTEVLEGSTVNWNFDKHGPIDEVRFHFNDKSSQLNREKQFFKPSFYYYSVLDTAERKTISQYYSIKVKEDSKPIVEISGLEEFQRLPWKKNYNIAFDISILDDFQVEDAFISATVANGQGESVKFREKTFPLKNFTNSNFSFSTEELEMEPGSELYFYVMAKDNCPYRIQATKSTTYFVVLEDTVTYDFVEDAGMQVDLMPDFFRSQRQIIIDSEKLISEKSSIPEQEFKQRSNELGFDQKMLRLKYGQFLGEEAESGIAIENEIEEDHDHDHDHEEGGGELNVLEEFGHNHDHEAEENQLLETNGTKPKDPTRPEWVEALSHNHDDAEENTYFEVSLKSKLKAALSVMWDSELHLRLYDPEKSLPFQYEALEYLQEIKNHARIYVHRIGFDPPAIKIAEKRLTGEQKKIVSPSAQKEREEMDSFKDLKKAISHFSSRSNFESRALNIMDKNILQSAGDEIAGIAIEEPSLLPILTLIRATISQEREFDDVQKQNLINALLKALPKEKKSVIHREARIHPVNKAALKAL